MADAGTASVGQCGVVLAGGLCSALSSGREGAVLGRRVASGERAHRAAWSHRQTHVTNVTQYRHNW